MTIPDYETTIIKNGQEIFIELYNIEYYFEEAEPFINVPDLWDVTDYESKVFIGDDEVMDEQVKKLYLDALDEDDILFKMIPVWEEERACEY